MKKGRGREEGVMKESMKQNLKVNNSNLFPVFSFHLPFYMHIFHISPTILPPPFYISPFSHALSPLFLTKNEMVINLALTFDTYIVTIVDHIKLALTFHTYYADHCACPSCRGKRHCIWNIKILPLLIYCCLQQ